MSSLETKKCSRCKKIHEICDFINDKGKELVTCITCRNKKKNPKKKDNTMKKNKCETCCKNAVFNKPEETEGRFCYEHKKIGMIDVKNKKCQHLNCFKRPCFNKPGEIEGRFCYEHKEDGMIDVKNKKCEHDDCLKRPYFNKPGETEEKFCYEHKEDGMIDVKHKKCKHDDCLKIPCFNKPGETEGLFCYEHKEYGMIDVKNKKCEYAGCLKRSCFNNPGEKEGMFCYEHKEDGMIDVKHKKCEHDDCLKIPLFNKSGETEGRFCYEHKEDGMVDVKNKKCEYDDCLKRPYFGFCSQLTTCCATHKLKYMFKKPKRKCITNKCKELATYGQTEPTHCETHSQENEISLLTQKCCNCGDIDLLNRDGLCITKCKPLGDFYKQKSYQKEKEILMLNYLDKYLKNFESEYKIIDDKTIDTSCNLYRPDRRYDCGTHQVIIECDEHQHKNREYCEKYTSLKHFEECRMFEIQQACGMNCIFIRWNPDTFKIKDKICKKFNNQKRLETLVKWVQYCFNLEIDKESPPQYIQLFFDEYDETNVEFTQIMEKDVIFTN